MEDGGPDDLSPAEFVKKIREMGEQRDREDAARFAQLEQDIYRDREQRAARRAERARSISPEKSLTSTPTSLRHEYTPSPVQPPNTREADTMEETRATPSSLGRSGTLSWQQRPTSMSNRRPLSMLAAENAARSPRLSPDRNAASEKEDRPEPTRAQIAESLASRDPNWFKQTAERGASSAAYRRSREESTEDTSSYAKQQLPGMAGTPNRSEPEQLAPRVSTPAQTSSLPTPPSASIQAGAMRSTAGWNNRNALSAASTATPEAVQSPMDAPRLTPALDSTSTSRPTSPTKGMGGFVQSAMMKRSDSVSKRWSAQAGPSLSRQSSTASNRGHRDGGLMGSTSMPRLDMGMSISPSRGMSPVSRARPTSSHGDSTFGSTLRETAEDTEKEQSSKSSHTLHSRSKSVASLRSNAPSEAGDVPAPSSPTKRWSRSPTKSSWLESALNKPEEKPKFQVAPSQPAWMVNLSKAKAQKESLAAEDASKLDRETLVVEDEPRSMEKSREDPFISAKAKSPPPEPVVKPISLTKEHSAPAALVSSFRASPTPPPKPAVKPFEAGKKPINAPQTDFRANLRSRQAPAESEKDATPEFLGALGKLRRAKTENYVAPDILKGNILQGKAALTVTGGPAKRERVDELKESLVKQKEAMKEKAAIEGPRKSSREVKPVSTPEALAKRQQLGGASTFKDPLLEKKTQEAIVPEFLARQRTIKEKARPEVAQKPSLPNAKMSFAVPETVTPERYDEPMLPTHSVDPSIVETSSAPSVSEPAVDQEPGPVASPALPAANGASLRPGASSKLANRFNPALAGILSRGPSPLAAGRPAPTPITNDAGISPPTTRSQPEQPSKELTHMTKGRARGPKRKAPTSKACASAPEEYDFNKATETPAVIPGQGAAPSQKKISSIYDVPLVKKAFILPSSPISTTNPVNEEIPKPKPSAPVKSPQLSTRNFTPTRPSSLDAEVTSHQPSGLSAAESSRNATTLAPSPVDKPSKPSPIISNKPAQIKTQRSPMSSQPRNNDFTPPQSADVAGSTPQLWGKSIPYLSARDQEETPGSNMLKTPISALTTPSTAQRSGSPEREADDLSKVSVKSAMSAWGRDPETQAGSQRRARSPIKLPTKEDEERINQEAGLVRDADRSHSRGVGAVGLGLSANPVNTNNSSSSRSTTLFPLSPPLSAGLPLLPDHNTVVDTERLNGIDGDEDTSPKTSKTHLSIETRDMPPPSLMKSPELRSRPVSMSIKVPESPIPKTSEANRLFTDFFDDRPFLGSEAIDVDVEAVLSASRPKYDKMNTIRKMMHEVSPDGKMLPVPSHQEHVLFEESMYLIIHAYQSANESRSTIVYLWVGSGVAGPSTSEALLLGRKVAKDYGSRLTLVRQGKETHPFFQAIGGILVTFRGQRRTTTRTGLPKTFMLCARKHEGGIAIDEVEFALDSFCSGFAYIVCSNSRLYLWKGKGCYAEELGCARLIAMDLASSLDVIEVNEGNEPTSLFRIFPSTSPLGSLHQLSSHKFEPSIPPSSDHWLLKSQSERYRCRLFRVSQPSEPSLSSPIHDVNKTIRRQDSTASSLSNYSVRSNTTTTPTQETTVGESPSTPTRERSSVTSFFSAWGSAASTAAGTMVRKKSWSSMIPLSTASGSNSPTRTSTPATPITPGVARPSSRSGYFSSAFSAGGGLLGFRRKDSEDLTSASLSNTHVSTSDEGHENASTTLLTKSSTGCTISEIAPFAQSDLSPEGIYVLDAYFSLTVIVRPLASDQTRAFLTALVFAQDYVIVAASREDRPSISVGRVLVDCHGSGGSAGNGYASGGGVDKDSRACFRGWSLDRERRVLAEARMERVMGRDVDDLARDRDRAAAQVRSAGVGDGSNGDGSVVVGLGPALAAVRSSR